MNREIKFRAWHKEKNIMFNNFAITATGKLLMTTRKRFSEYPGYDNDSCILMQFTGLKDKNGTPIFESDVVEVLFNEGTYLKANPVIWSNNNCIFAVENGEMHESLSGIVNIEVIGNIFENPELVQKSS